MLVEELVIASDDPVCRLDLFLHYKFPHYSRTYFQQLIELNLVKINEICAKKRIIPQIGDKVTVTFEQKTLPHLTPQAMNLDILYEDDVLLAINKPRGLVVHPAPGHPSNTLVNGLLYHYQSLHSLDPLRPGIVHRLDKDTSGILLIAKTPYALEKLSLSFKERTVHKEYLALCIGNPGTTTVQNQLGRDPRHRQKIAIVDKGKEALSWIETLSYKQGYSLVKIIPSTGRTHQIRVHLQSLGCPIIGDPLYGHPKTNQRLNLFQQMLHAYQLEFTHPVTGKLIVIKAELPDDMLETKKKLF